MPKVAKELGALAVSRLKHHGQGLPTSVSVGGVSGLMLQITNNDAKSWLLRIMIGGKRREVGLGAYPEVSLFDAREKARAAKSSVKSGVDPVEEKRSAKLKLLAAQKRTLTFNDAVDRYLQNKLQEFRNDKHKRQWRSTLDTYAKPYLGAMHVENITVHDILQVLEPIWIQKTETASRLRGRIESVLAWATVKGHRSGDNPARWRGNLIETLPKANKVAICNNQPALRLQDIQTWFIALRRREGMSARALEFLTLTAARSGEVRGATWDEIDLSNGVWTIPASRMKAGREHRVPLVQSALDLLEVLPRPNNSNRVFPAIRGGALSDMSLSAVMRRMQSDEVANNRKGWLDRMSGRAAVPHGLRSSFRDWAAEMTDYPREIAELALAHNVGSKVERAYRRGDALEKRRAMMIDWCNYCEGING